MLRIHSSTISNMINLLPEKEKREIEMEVTVRKIFICLIFVSVSLIFLIFILSSLKIYISGQRESLESILVAKEAELRTSEFQNFKKIITKTNQDLSKIQKLYNPGSEVIALRYSPLANS